MKINDITKINQLFTDQSDTNAENMLMGSLASHDFTGMARTFFITKLDSNGDIKRKFHQSCMKILGHSKDELESRETSYFDNVVLNEIVNDGERIEYKKSIKDLVKGKTE